MSPPARSQRLLCGALAVAALGGCAGEILDVEPGSCGGAPVPAPEASVRLDARQLRNTVAALFPFPIDIGDRYPSAPYRQSYTTAIAASALSAGDVEALADTAEAIALQAVPHLGELLPCRGDPDEAACARQFIDDFVPRAYRRPLQPGEIEPLAALYADVRPGLGFDLSIGAVIAAVLQSPPFLYRLEVGVPAGAGLRRLTGDEVAARLSYLYWDAPPDDELLAEAHAGGLARRDGVARQAARLLDDPRARPVVWRFLSEWLGFGDQLYAGRTDDPALAADFAEEARRFLLDVALDDPDATVADLFGSGKTFVSGRLARHYGLDAWDDDDEWRAVTLPPAQAAGVLAKAQVAAAHDPVGATSIVQRGHLVYERLLCRELGTPPPGAQAVTAGLGPDGTPRSRMEARAAVALCAGCHLDLDGVGIGLEDLDALARPRSRYPSGAPVDAGGVVRALPGAPPFDGTAALGGLLAGEPLVAGCLARQWYRYATGHHETDAEACHVARLEQTLAASGGHLRALLLGIADTDAFVYRSR